MENYNEAFFRAKTNKRASITWVLLLIVACIYYGIKVGTGTLTPGYYAAFAIVGWAVYIVGQALLFIKGMDFKPYKWIVGLGYLAFASMFVISVLAIIIQMLLTVDIRLVLGETATALVGGILYASIMVYNGIWDKCLPKSATIWRDFLTSVICAGIFTVIYGVCLFRMGATETQITRLALGFLIGITIVAFIILRLLAFINRKRNQNLSNVQEKKEISLSQVEWTKIYNAQNIVETEQLVEMLKQNGIAAFSQEAGAKDRKSVV